MRKILVTSALPYINGHIHLGYLVEAIQTDIWVRFQKLRGHDVRYFCADDTHGTATMLRAKSEGRTEAELVAAVGAEHRKDLDGFGISFDHFSHTDTEASRDVCNEIWKALRDAEMIVEKDVEQLFDTQEGIFLADRFVRGTCPNCKSTDQPGDNCSKCDATYTPADLIDPVSVVSGTRPETRNANHLLVNVEKMHSFLEEWTQSGTLPSESANYLKGFFLNEPLRDWDVSRPAPYFGFEIPDSPGNYWYVWFDAPIGYIGATSEWCAANGQELADWWKNDNAEIHHFIGKDIQYFHTLFWPVMLKTAGFTLPSKVRIHGFLTVDGKKMSKSDGTYIKAATYLNHLDPAALRYFYASRLSSKVEDIDLNLEEFATKVNTDLVGKVVNIASRTAKFIADVGLSAEYPEDGGMFADAAVKADAIAEAYENTDYGRAMRLIIEIADKVNPYVESNAPWELRKDPANAQKLQDVCTVALNIFRQLTIFLTPVLPRLAEQAGELFDEPITSWEQAKTPLVGRPVGKFKHMMQRIDPKKIAAMVEESKEEAAAEAALAKRESAGSGDSGNSAQWDDSADALVAEPLADGITIDDFMKVDLRVARIVEANEVPEARKLVQLTLSLGGDERRNVFAGIKSAYDPADLVGRLVVLAANLAPRKMKFGVSEGMVIASGPGGKEIYLLSPDSGAVPGQRVH
ncbi:MAG: methionyl-tRNA synthetase [Verrucomicrobiales bacterium]|jgi:methionyl-tRNA synthetase